MGDDGPEPPVDSFGGPRRPVGPPRLPSRRAVGVVVMLGGIVLCIVFFGMAVNRLGDTCDIVCPPQDGDGSGPYTFASFVSGVVAFVGFFVALWPRRRG